MTTPLESKPPRPPASPHGEASSTTNGLSPEACRALDEATAWRLLSLLLERPRGGWAEEVASLASALGQRGSAVGLEQGAAPAGASAARGHGPERDGLALGNGHSACHATGPLSSHLLEAAAAARDAGEGAYLASLGNGGISPRETSYRGGFEDPARVLAELSAYYTAFAYAPRAEDPPDHVAVEAGFAGYLALKQAYALAEGNNEAASIAAAASERFVATHLRPMAGPLCRRLTAAAAPAWLERAARALVDRAGDTPDPRIAGPGDDDAPLPACGMSPSGMC